ncbi:ribosomal large subunit pseudouridine synthase D [[Leptolyngbya] sp. PCC 7376]|uniref:RluA family pseudouridine synthase n=1 Tax=[Leptolyngbya] sp. PCC 7376 TaxID=111781 RepID=UPI00029F1A45|nr:RluA family pseudouridine synthase [[Leptolyngbya] sp. PCC 7376]AFY36771.1 ribosomal large subunit pseudouridine synthase D [[Leptolyngbya] sp. PCC 7376]
MVDIRQYQVTAEAQGQRLDQWLSLQLDDLSRSRIQKLIGQGQVAINEKVCTTKKYKLSGGDRLQVTIPAPVSLELQPEAMDLDILFEDDHFLIVNKAANVVVHPAPGHYTGTLVHGLLAHCGDRLAGIGGVQRPGIVHRLDKDTTGAIAIAKTDQAHQHLQAQIKAKTARREYLGVVYGCPQQPAGIVEAPIDRHKIDRKKMAVIESGRPALTRWELQERLGNYSLLYYRLETGRTHQIRVHSAHMGHPIVGDPLYSSNRTLKVNLTGQALHARKLIVEHPITGEIIEAIAPLPPEFEKLLKVLRQRC